MGAGFMTLARRSSDANDYYLESSGLPMHKTMVGITAPIGCGLDRYARHGLTDPDGATPNDLNSFYRHTVNGVHHYHSTKTCPYLNGGIRGTRIVGSTWPALNQYSLESELTRRLFVND